MLMSVLTACQKKIFALNFSSRSHRIAEGSRLASKKRRNRVVIYNRITNAIAVVKRDQSICCRTWVMKNGNLPTYPDKHHPICSINQIL